MRIALHDRDGHLVCPFPEDVPNYESLTPFERNAPWYIRSPERQMILPGVPELLKQFDLNFVISNQKLRNKTVEQICDEAIWLMQQLPIQGFLFSPDDGKTGYWVYEFGMRIRLHKTEPDLSGEFRKPQTGLIEALKRSDYPFSNAELFGFGDRITDKQCFELAGAQFEWSDIARGYPDPSMREMS